eukprot:jgi/Bigna1/73255/fgenesh1_pg.23_\
MRSRLRSLAPPVARRSAVFSTSRRYPENPRVGVSAAIFSCVEGSTAPSTLPGGSLELGETVQAAIAREIKEETTLDISPTRAFSTTDSIHLDEDSKIEFHYVIVHTAATVSNEPKVVAQEDVDALLWVPVDQLQEIEGLVEGTTSVVHEGIEHLLMKESLEDLNLYNVAFAWYNSVDPLASQVRDATSLSA